MRRNQRSLSPLSPATAYVVLLRILQHHQALGWLPHLDELDTTDTELSMAGEHLTRPGLSLCQFVSGITSIAECGEG